MKMRGNIPRRQGKLSKAELQERYERLQNKVAESMAKNRLRFILEGLDKLPEEVKEAIEELTGKPINEFATEVNTLAKEKVDAKNAKDDQPERGIE